MMCIFLLAIFNVFRLGFHYIVLLCFAANNGPIFKRETNIGSLLRIKYYT